MSEASVQFFKDLGRRGHEPLLAKVSGRVRFEVVDDGVGRWLVAIDSGDVAVAHKGRGRGVRDPWGQGAVRPDCRGEENGMAAVLRGALVCTGDIELLYAIQRIFPALGKSATWPGVIA